MTGLELKGNLELKGGLELHTETRHIHSVTALYVYRTTSLCSVHRLNRLWHPVSSVFRID